MQAEGYDNADVLRGVLMTWRERRQDQWLKTDWLVKMMMPSFDARDWAQSFRKIAIDLGYSDMDERLARYLVCQCPHAGV